VSTHVPYVPLHVATDNFIQPDEGSRLSNFAAASLISGIDQVVIVSGIVSPNLHSANEGVLLLLKTQQHEPDHRPDQKLRSFFVMVLLIQHRPSYFWRTKVLQIDK
jgi:hypothetical protein